MCRTLPNCETRLRTPPHAESFSADNCRTSTTHRSWTTRRMRSSGPRANFEFVEPAIGDLLATAAIFVDGVVRSALKKRLKSVIYQ